MSVSDWEVRTINLRILETPPPVPSSLCGVNHLTCQACSKEIVINILFVWSGHQAAPVRISTGKIISSLMAMIVSNFGLNIVEYGIQYSIARGGGR